MQPLFPPGLRPVTLIDVVDAERAQVAAGTPACGHTCACHSGLPCVRIADHATTAAAFRDVHVGIDPDGLYVQYQANTCT